MTRLFLALAAAAAAFAQSPLTIERIMKGPEFYGYAPADVRWSGDGQRLYFSWKRASDKPEAPMDTYVANRDGSGLRKLTDAETRLAVPPNAVYTRDRKLGVYADNGDIYLYTAAADQSRRLTRTSDAESYPHFTQDEKRVTFVRGGNLFAWSIADGAIEQLTDIRAAGQGPDEKKNTDSQKFLVNQEKALLQTVRERVEQREAGEARTKADNPRKPYVLKAGQTVPRMLLCPDGSCVVAAIRESDTGSKPDNVPNYITESAYTEEIRGRTNVGDAQAHARIVLLNTSTGEATPLDAGLGTRDVDFGMPIFNEQGTRAVVEADATDNKQRWILAIDLKTGKCSVVFTETDMAWLGGPGDQTLGWLKNGDEVYFQSEGSGYSHLYRVQVAGGDAAATEVKALTSGSWEVIDAKLSRDGSQFYLVTNEVGPAEHQVYTMSVNGGSRTRITSAAGSHDAVVSPDGRYFADIHSYANLPPELFVAETRAGAEMKKITDSPSADFWTYKWIDPPIVQVTARDGVKVPARFYKPTNYRAGGPAVVFVHGAGYLQNVHKWWSQYSREYLFHHYLMEHGYMVLDMDYRGSAGYGRDWRTAIYRHMGGTDLDDEVDGAKWLVSQGADPKRIGVYGGSYGGFITLMAMFTSPDTFAAGAALRPVTDWAHYNHGYTSNILNVPQGDAEAYKRSSPIYFAEGLKGALLICHGMVDTNVFFQDSVRLVQRLIELGKENWTFAPYPVEDHGFVRASSWTDEYKRIFNLFESTLKK